MPYIRVRDLLILPSMSFGYSIGDIFILGQLAWNIYEACKSAPESFKNMAHDVLSLHTVLKKPEIFHSDDLVSDTGVLSKYIQK